MFSNSNEIWDDKNYLWLGHVFKRWLFICIYWTALLYSMVQLRFLPLKSLVNTSTLYPFHVSLICHFTRIPLDISGQTQTHWGKSSTLTANICRDDSLQLGEKLPFRTDNSFSPLVQLWSSPSGLVILINWKNQYFTFFSFKKVSIETLRIPFKFYVNICYHLDISIFI